MRKWNRISMLLLFITFYGCEKISQKNFDKINLGMSKSDVEDIFGPSDNGSYGGDKANIYFKYDRDTVIAKSYEIKDNNQSEESILEGPVSLSIPVTEGARSMEISSAFINGYELELTSSTKYIDESNNNKSYDFVMGSNYKVTGILDFSKITVKKIEKVYYADEMNPQDAKSYSKRGYTKMKFNDYRGALSDYSKVIELKPADTLAYINRAYVKSQLEDSVGAKLDLQKAVSYGSSSASYYLKKIFK